MDETKMEDLVKRNTELIDNNLKLIDKNTQLISKNLELIKSNATTMWILSAVGISVGGTALAILLLL